MKKLISILVALTLSSSMFVTSPVNAEITNNSSVVDVVEPAYVYAASVSSILTVNNTVAYCNSKATGMSGVTKIVATQYLERKVLTLWFPVSSWSKTSNTNSLTMSNSKNELGSGTYRLRTVFNVYNGSDVEEIEKISSEKTI